MPKVSGRTLGVVSVILLIAGFFVRGPMPEILVPAEPLAHPFGFNLTNTIIAAWVTILFLLFIAYKTTGFSYHRMQLVPSGLQNLVEAIVEVVLDFVVGVAGEKNARRFFPVVATIFLFVVTNAWMSLLPGFGSIGIVEAKEHGHAFSQVDLGGLKLAFILPGESSSSEKGSEGHEEVGLKGALVPLLRGANTDLNTPLALAIMSAIFVEYWGISTLGLFTYGSKFINVGQLLRGQVVMGLVDVFVGLMELISETARLISFTFRLFGNMFAGEVLLAVITFLVPWVAVLPFMGLEIFVGFVQALVFAGLTLVFAVVAISGHGEESHH